MDIYHVNAWAANQAGLGDQVTIGFAFLSILYIFTIATLFTIKAAVATYRLVCPVDPAEVCKDGQPHPWAYAEKEGGPYTMHEDRTSLFQRCFRCGASGWRWPHVKRFFKGQK